MSMYSQRYTLDDLASRANDIRANGQKNNSANCNYERVTVVRDFNGEVKDNKMDKKTGWSGVTWFVVIALVVGVLLFLFRPTLVLSTNSNTNEVYLDWGKLFLWSVVFALVVVLLVWFFRGAFQSQDMKM